MEAQFRKYFHFKAPFLSLKSRKTHLAGDIDLLSVAYEATVAGPKPPVFISQPLRRSMTKQISRNISDGLAIQSFSYDSTLAGKSPTLGSRPYKGNGPVKLQTSRRLSSGELLVTTQDHQRTLEDIREGEYVVGGSEKRNSRASQIRSPIPSLRGPLSPRSPRSTISSNSSYLPKVDSIMGLYSSPADVMQRGGIPFDPCPPRLEISSPPIADFGSQSNVTSDGIGHGLAISNIATAVEEEVPHLGRSHLAAFHEHNATVQALLKAEKTRLATICGAQELPRTLHRADGSCRSSLPSRQEAIMPATMPGVQIIVSSIPESSQGVGTRLQTRRISTSSSTRDQIMSDASSECSFNKRSSLGSTKASLSSSSTAWTSILEPEHLATRKDVRRIVEDMRLNYIRAIEAKTVNHEPTIQATTGMPTTTPSCNLPPPNFGHQSAYAGSVVPPTNFGGISKETPLETLTTEATLNINSAPKLGRADSMTLGSLMSSPRSPRRSRKKASSNSQPIQSKSQDNITPEIGQPEIFPHAQNPTVQILDLSSCVLSGESYSPHQPLFEDATASDLEDMEKNTT